jgi:hypothetical protein
MILRHLPVRLPINSPPRSFQQSLLLKLPQVLTRDALRFEIPCVLLFITMPVYHIISADINFCVTFVIPGLERLVVSIQGLMGNSVTLFGEEFDSMLSKRRFYSTLKFF